MGAEPSDWPELVITKIITKCFEADWSFYTIALQINKTWNSIAETIAQRHPCPWSILKPKLEIPESDKQVALNFSAWQPFEYPLFHSKKQTVAEFTRNLLECEFQRDTQLVDLSEHPWTQPPWWIYQDGFIEAIVFDSEPQEIEFWSLDRSYGSSFLQPDQYEIIWLNMLPSGRYFPFSHIFFTTKRPAKVRFISHIPKFIRVGKRSRFEIFMSDLGLLGENNPFSIRLGDKTFVCSNGVLALFKDIAGVKNWQTILRQHVKLKNV